MAFIVPNEGEIEMLTRILSVNVTLRLFVDPTALDETDVFADFTEPSGGGYATITLAPGDWTIVTGGDGKALATQAQKTFAFTSGPISVYGYFITDAAGALVLWEELFTDGPYDLPDSGGEIRVTPQAKLH